MGAQIIKRQEGTAQEISTIDGRRTQISYNSDGHIVIRYINSNCADTLIVLDLTTSAALISFVQNMIKKPELPF